jgi:hypothetical protein
MFSTLLSASVFALLLFHQKIPILPFYIYRLTAQLLTYIQEILTP